MNEETAGWRQEQGILALIDVVHFTNQANRLGNRLSAKFLDYFHVEVKKLVESYDFQVIGTAGDAVILFGHEPEEFLKLILGLFKKNAVPDRYGFSVKLRLVGNSSYYHFKVEEGRRVKFAGSEAVRIFRMEKAAQANEVIVTASLYRGVQKFLNKYGIACNEEIWSTRLKGFDDEEWNPPYYRLLPPVLEAPSGEFLVDILDHRIEVLRDLVRKIPVFGNMYEPLDMERNFINLVMDPELQTGRNFEPRKRDLPMRPPTRDGMKPEHPSEKKITEAREILAGEPCAFIYGLPGAGKTTTMRYFTHLVFKEYPEMQPVYVNCGCFPDFEKWKRFKDYDIEPFLSLAELDVKPVLEYVAFAFLYPRVDPERLLPEQYESLQDAEQRVAALFHENRLALFIDALDEAAPANKAIIVRFTRKLMELVCREEEEPCEGAMGNRVYLTSRPHERENFIEGRIPVFHVEALDKEQLRVLARHFYGEGTDLYREFDRAIWEEEIIEKIANTPLTALLIMVCFKTFHRFDRRYPMYDLLMKFLLLRVWAEIKADRFQRRFGAGDISEFLIEARKDDFLTRYPEINSKYRYLSILSFECLYESLDGMSLLSIPEATLVESFRFSLSNDPEFKGNAKELAQKWFEQFKHDAVLISTGHKEYGFVHSTFMEFLAARKMVELDGEQKLRLSLQQATAEEYLALDTLPIACGRDMDRGLAIFGALSQAGLPRKVQKLPYLALLFRCLTELESIMKTDCEVLRIRRLQEEFRRQLEPRMKSLDWVYVALAQCLLDSDKEALGKYIKAFAGLSRLPLGTLLDRHVEMGRFFDAPSDVLELRRKLLAALAITPVIRQFEKKWTERSEFITSISEVLLNFTSPGYSPEDKNFKYYRNLVGAHLKGFFGSPNLRHSHYVYSVSFSPDGQYVISASSDNTLKLWKADTGKEIRTFRGHTHWVRSAVFSPDGKLIISASSDNTLRLWETDTGKELRAFKGHKDRVRTTSFSPDGALIVSGSSDNTVKIWETETGKEVRTLKGHADWVRSAVFSPDGRTIISASADDTLKLWDTATGEELRTFEGHENYINSVSFSRDGRLIVSASDDNTVKLWDTASGKELRTFRGHGNYVNSVAFSPEGAHIATASDDYTIRLWDIETGADVRTFIGHSSYVNCAAFSPDGEVIVSGASDNAVRFWEVKTGKELRTFRGHGHFVNRAAFSPDGASVISASSDCTVKLWEASSGREVRTLSGHTDYVNSAAFSPDGKLVVSAGDDLSVRIWEAQTGKEIRSIRGHSNYVNVAFFSPEGGHILTASSDTTMMLWDAATGDDVYTFRGHKDSVRFASFSPDGRYIISASDDHVLRLWLADREEEIQVFRGHLNYVNSVSFSPEGRYIISASSDCTLRLWDVSTGREVRTFKGHGGYVNSGAFSLDGRFVFSASSDCTLKLWEAATGREILTIELPWVPLSITVHPKNPCEILVANANGTVALFDMTPE